MPETARDGDGNIDGNFDGGRSLTADEDEDGPWSEGSESGEEDSSSSDDEEDSKEAEDRRVEALYKIATGGGGGGDGSDGGGEIEPATHDENTAAVDTTRGDGEPVSVGHTAAMDTAVATAQPEKEAAPAKTVAAEAGTAAPCSEPEVIPLSALPALAKEFAAAEAPSEKPQKQPDLAANQCSQAAEAVPLQEGGSIAAPVPPS